MTVLCRFSVENFRNIRFRTVLNLRAADIPEHEEHVLLAEDGSRFLPVAVIYGPNGRGKSNVLKAMHALRGRVMRSLCALCGRRDCVRDMTGVVVPFADSGWDPEWPTEFAVSFRTPRAEYRYILELKRNVVVYESLESRGPDQEESTALFKRDPEGVQMSSSFGAITAGRELADALPLLSYLGSTFSSNETVRDVLGWFEGSIHHNKKEATTL